MIYELLKIICHDYGILEYSEEFCELLGFYELNKRVPTFADVSFVREALRIANENAEKRILLGEVKCVSEDFRELLGEFIRRYTSASKNGKHPYLTDLAEFAASGKTTQDQIGIQADLADNRIFPAPYDGSHETLQVGELLLTLSYGKRVGGDLAGDICTIISPAPEQDVEEFIEKATQVCREFTKAHPATVIKSVTSAGLLYDLSFMNDGYVIDTRLLPVSGEKVEAIFNIKPPAVLLFPKREDLHELWMISAVHGITPTAPIANRAKLISIRCADAVLEFTGKEIEFLFGKSKDHRLDSCDLPALSDASEIVFENTELIHSPYTVTLTKIGGRIYEELDAAMADRDSAYVIAGVLNKEDPAVLPLIITLDSFRRNNSPNVIYSRFFMGEKTSLYVFKLSKKK